MVKKKIEVMRYPRCNLIILWSSSDYVADYIRRVPPRGDIQVIAECLHVMHFTTQKLIPVNLQ